ncbi:DUF11 domain-containing protein [Rhodobacterales bacterium]|nr:DUF11 domain-containing protein [Rhodobacterales bacterium]
MKDWVIVTKSLLSTLALWMSSIPLMVAGALFYAGMAIQPALAQSGGEFTCDGSLWLTQGFTEGGNKGTRLYRIDVSQNPAVLAEVGSAGIQYNSAGYNPADDYIYAISSKQRGSLPRLVKVFSDGTATVVDADPDDNDPESPVGNMNNHQYVMGAFSSATSPSDEFYNKMFVLNYGGADVLRIIDLSSRVYEAEIVDLKGRDVDASDVAWAGGLLYAVQSPDVGQGSRLIAINPRDGTVQKLGLTGVDFRFGALFSTAEGLYGVANGGAGLFEFDLETGRATLISGAPGSSVNDGASCASSSIDLPADISVTKTNTFNQNDGPNDLADDTYTPGENRTYTMVVGNNGPFGASRVRVLDTLPDGIDESTVSWTCSSENGPMVAGGGVCNEGAGASDLDTSVSLPVGTSVRLDLTMSVPDRFNGNLTNLVSVSTIGKTDENTDNNEAIDDDIGPISLEKRLLEEDGVIEGQAEAGELLTYAIRVANANDAAVTGIDITDVFDENTSFVAFGPSTPTGTVDDQTITWTNLSVAANSATSLEVTVRVIDPIPDNVTSILNLVHFTDQDPPLCEEGDPLCVETPTEPKISATKELAAEDGVIANVAEPGETLTYFIEVRNDGGSAAENYLIKDSFDPAAAILEINPGFGPDDSLGFAADPETGSISWIVPLLPEGESVGRSVRVTLKDPLPKGVEVVTNTVTTDCTITDETTGEPCDVTLPTAPLVTFGKELTDETGEIEDVAEAGETLTYTITLSNYGGTTATDYTQTDTLSLLPASIVRTDVIASVSASDGGTYNSSTGVTTWTGLTVPTGDDFTPGIKTLTLDVTLANPLPEDLTRIDNILPCIEEDPVSGLLCRVVLPTEPQIKTVKTLTSESGVIDDVVENGETLTYTITITNTGSTSEPSYSLDDVLTIVPASIISLDDAIASVSASDGGTYDPATGVTSWTGLSVEGSDGTNPGERNVTVSVTMANPLPEGLLEVKNTVTTDCTVTDTTTGAPCDVITPTVPSVTTEKVLEDESGLIEGVVEDGETLTYEITITNTGGTAVSGYTLTDTLSYAPQTFNPGTDFIYYIAPEQTFVSFETSEEGSYDVATGEFVFRNLTIPAQEGDQPGTKVVTIEVTMADPLPVGLKEVTNAVTTDCTITDETTGEPCEVTTPTDSKVTFGKELTDETGDIEDVAEAGETLTYTITLSNSGGTPVTDYTQTDTLSLLPASIVRTDVIASVSASDGGTYNSSTGVTTWTGLTVPVGDGIQAGTKTLTLDVTLANPLPEDLTRIDNILPCTGFDTDLELPCRVDLPTEPQIKTVKTLTSESGVIDDVVENGETLTYTITITNTGGTSELSYSLDDVLTIVPASIISLEDAIASVSASDGGTYDPATGVTSWTGLSVEGSDGTNPGEKKVTVSVTMANPLPGQLAEVTNIVTTDCTVTDTTTGAPCEVSTPTVPWIQTGKVLADETGVIDGVAEPGETLTYTLTATNNGGTDSSAYVLRDTFAPAAAVASIAGGDGPEDALFFSADPSTGAISWTIPTIAVGQSVTRSVKITLTDPLPTGLQVVTNTVVNDCTETDATTGAPCRVDTPTLGGVDLRKDLTGETGTQSNVAEPGETLTYTITATNTGGTDLENYELRDAFTPIEAIDALNNTGGGTSNATSGVTTWTIDLIPAGESVTRTVSVTLTDPLPPATPEVTNLVHFTDDPEPDCPSLFSDTDVTDDPRCVVTETPGEITIEKRLTGESVADDEIAQPGEELTYTITLTNSGGTDVNGHTLKDAVDPNTTFVSATPPATSFSGSEELIWSDLTIPANSSIDVSVTIRVVDEIPDGVTQIKNVAYTVEPPSCEAPDPRCVSNPTEPKIRVVKTLDAESGLEAGVAEAGETLTYTLTFRNVGGTEATIDVTDDLELSPATILIGDAVVSAVPSDSGNYSAGRTVWNDVTIPAQVGETPGETKLTLAITLSNPLPDGLKEISNIVTDPCEIVPGDGQVCRVDTPTPSILSQTKALTDESGDVDDVAEPGEVLTYTITITNSGGATATNYVVDDLFEPASAAASIVAGDGPNDGLNFSSDTNTGAISWTIPTINANETVTRSAKVTMRNPLPDDVLAVTNSVLNDCEVVDPTTGAPCRVTLPTPPSISATKALTDEDGSIVGVAEAGETLTYTITVTNSGGTEAVDYEIEDAFVPAAAAATIVAGDGADDPVNFFADPDTGEIRWTVPSIMPNATVTRSVKVTLTEPLPSGLQSVTNTVITNCTVIDPTTGFPCSVTNPSEPKIVQTKALTAENGLVDDVAEAGETLTYTITISNDGGQTASNVIVEDTFEPASAAVSIIAGNRPGDSLNFTGNAATGEIRWQIPSLESGETVTRSVRITLASPLPAGLAAVTNTVTSNCTETNPTTGAPCRVTTPTQPSIETVKALTDESGAVDGIAEAGETLTYTITINNSGGADVTDYVLQDVFGPGAAAASIVAGDGPDDAVNFQADPSTGAIQWIIPDVAAGETLTRTAKVTLTDPLPSGLEAVSNTVLTDCTVTNATTGFPCEVTTPAGPSLSTTKALTAETGSKPGLAEPGETLTYTISVTNTGGAEAVDYRLEDIFVPVGAAASIVAGAGADDAVNFSVDLTTGTIAWTIPSIAVGQTVERSVQIALANPLPSGLAAVTNTVTTDCTVINTTTGAPCEVTTPTESIVSTTKQLTDESGQIAGVAEPGETLTYTITVSNTGGAEATNFKVEDFFTPAAAAISILPGPNPNDAQRFSGNPRTGAMSWTIPSLPAGETITRSARVVLTEEFPEGVTEVRNIVTTRCVVTDVTTGAPCEVVTPTDPDITFEKALTGETGEVANIAEPGETLTFTITLLNNGGSGETDYTLTDTLSVLPATVAVADAVASVSASDGGTYNPLNGVTTWNGLSVPAKVGGTPGMKEVTLDVTLASPLPRTLTDIINTLPCEDPSEPGCEVIIPSTSDVEFTKALVGESITVNQIAEAGETLTYEITLTNTGGQAATNFTLEDVFEPAEAIASVVPSNGGRYQGGGVSEWTGLTIPASNGGTPGTLKVRVAVTLSNPLPSGILFVRNTLPCDEADCNVTTPTEPDVSEEKKLVAQDGVNDEYAEAGETLVYEITLTNNGGSDETSYTLKEALFPSSAAAEVTVSDNGTYDPSTGETIWTGLFVPKKENGTPGTKSVTLTARLKDPLPDGTKQIENTLGCEGAGCVVVLPTEPEVIATKTLVESGERNGFAEAGETFVYTITVTNLGGAAQTDYTLEDTLFLQPDTFGLSEAIASVTASDGGSYDPTTGTTSWDIASIGVDQTVTRTLTVVLADALPAGLTQIKNSVFDGCIVTPNDPATCVVRPTEPAVTTSKALTDESGTKAGVAEAGETLVYTITLQNAGGSEAVDFLLEDQLSALPDTVSIASTVVGATASDGGTFDVATGTARWTGLSIPAQVGDQPGLKQVTLTVQLAGTLPEGMTLFRNLVLTNCDPDAVGAECQVDIPTEGQVLQSKALVDEIGGAQEGVAEPGETLIYEITLVNMGGDIATDYLLRDSFTPTSAEVAIEAGDRIDDSLNFTSDASAGTARWVIPEIAPGETVTRQLKVTLADPLPEDVIEVRNLLPDCVAGGDRTCEVVTPVGVPSTDITVIKKAGLKTVHRGDKVPYTILVTNNASLGSARLTVTDRIPSGFRYVPNSGSVGGDAREPTISGRTLSFENVLVAPGETVEVKLKLMVLSSVEAGRHKNFANATGPGGDPVGPDATAEVIVLVDAVFDCAEIIGRVFDDANRNGYADDGEIGLPSVRVATVSGLLVTTDQYGRFHIPCADLPDSRIGTNFIMKLDTRTLPTGYRVTTENPRVVRLTAGKALKLNFGAALGRVVALNISDEAFKPHGVELTEQWKGQLGVLIEVLGRGTSILRLTYVDAQSDPQIIGMRMESLKNQISELWKASDGSYRLEIETRVESAK